MRRLSERQLWLALVPAGGVVVVVFTFVTAVLTRHGQTFENAALRAAAVMREPPVLLQLVTVPGLAIATVVVALIGVLRRRVDASIRAVAVLAVSNVLAQLLKYQLLDRPRLAPDALIANTFPSGHTTAYVSVLVALLIVVSDAWRPWVAAVGAVICACVVSLLLFYGLHRLSDIAGAAAVVLVVGCLGVSVPLPVPSRGPSLGGSGRVVVAILVAGVVLAGLVGLVLLVLSRVSGEHAGMLSLAATIAFGIAASTLAVAAFLAVLRTPAQVPTAV